jgi:hypothetical protein
MGNKSSSQATSKRSALKNFDFDISQDEIISEFKKINQEDLSLDGDILITPHFEP